MFLSFHHRDILSITPKYRITSYTSDSLLTNMVNTSPYVLPLDQPVVALDCTSAFNALTGQEKKYAHYLSRAAWNGGLVVLVQTSPESPLIHSLLHRIFIEKPLSEIKKTALDDAALSEDEFKAILIYLSGIITNTGNYKGFGDTKFIPGLPKEKFEAFVKHSAAYRNNPSLFQSIWAKVSDSLYSLKDNEKSLGFCGKGITTYFSGNCTVEDGNLVNEFLRYKSILAYNTRACKTVKNGISHFEVRLASAETNKEIAAAEEFKGAYFTVVHGDYSPIMKLVSENLLKAKDYAANEGEKHMLEYYSKSFLSGNIADHMEGSRYWIKDKGPVIE
ncbi:hypothetical protein J437_LFUL003833, partial [Ladona fulva]